MACSVSVRALRHPVLILLLSGVAAASDLVAPTEVVAQILVGRVTEAGNRRAVVGAIVRILPASGEGGVGVLTDADGRYRVAAPGAGTYSVVVERIGYAVSRFERVAMPASGTLELDLTVQTSAIDLVGFEVTGKGRSCELVATAAVETQAVWDEARKALEAARWTEQAASLRFRIRSREALLDVRSLAVREGDRHIRTEWGPNTVRSLPPQDLSEGGYVRDADDGSLELFAPDAAALLSSEFLATHCLELAAGPDSLPGRIGLRFRPVPGRQQRDIEGALWLDATSFRLEQLDFQYTNLPAWPGVEHAGGMVRFAELPDGRWIVRDWRIRAPVVGIVRSAGLNGTVERLMATGIAERGSEVLVAEGGGITWLADRPTGSVRGLAFDSLRSSPLKGAEVRLAGRSWRTRSDAQGRFSIEGIPPGVYRVEFSHPHLDSLGVEPGWREVEVAAGRTAELELAVPSWGTVLALGCASGGRHIVGLVTVAATGDPLPGASVVALDALSAEGVPLRTQTDSNGAFRLCGLPGSGPVHVVARVGPRTSNPRQATPPLLGYARADLVIDLSAGRVGAEAEPRSTLRAVSGSVLDIETQQPVGDVLVELLDTAGTSVSQSLTDFQGRFVLPLRADGGTVLRARRLGYADVLSGPLEGLGSRMVEVRMAPEALKLEGLVVAVEAKVAKLDRSGFYQRRFLSGGQFLVREEIEAMVPTRTTDILRRLPGVQPVTFGSESGNTTVRRVQLRGAVRFMNDQRCLPGLYIDGTLLRQPVIPTPEGLGDPFRWLSNYPQIDELVNPQDIEAMEVYDTPAVTPAQFQAPGPPCGVIVIWTRGGPGG